MSITRRNAIKLLAGAAAGIGISRIGPAFGSSFENRSGRFNFVTDLPKGPFEPNWDSVKQHYRAPQWFREAKFGIFIHWGVYAVPAYHNEWYSRHMYGQFAEWHTEHYGPPDKFGYKDFIPLFKAEKYDPDHWASLFKTAGAKYVVPVAEHHDGFAMYDSALTKWCAAKMGPKRDLIGDLAKSVRQQGLVFGLSSHRMEHYTFMYPTAKVQTDLFDPAYADFYGPPVPGHMDDGKAPPAFQEDWLARCKELVDKYHPQLIYFDNGINERALDPIKLRFTAYYYNRAREWGREVSVATKGAAYLAGNVRDFEKAVRGPKNILPGPWEIDDQIATNTWGYTNDIRYRGSASIVHELVDCASKDGNLLLNISPRADGIIPAEQQRILTDIGTWLKINGEAIYGSHAWARFGEGPSYDAQIAGATANEAARKPATGADFRFTTKGSVLFATALSWPGEQAVITSLANGKVPPGKIKSVTLLGHKGALKFTQDEGGLKVRLPAEKPCDYAFVFKLVGLSL